MSWLEKLLPPKITPTDPTERRSVPEGLWIKCPSCEAVLYKTDLEKNQNVCPHCSHQGYRGRLGLHELMCADEAVREGIRHRAPAAELQAAALRGGMRTLRQDGIEKVLAGITTFDEVRVVAN